MKSGKEVREFLRGLGISLDSGAAVIKQVGLPGERCAALSMSLAVPHIAQRLTFGHLVSVPFSQTSVRPCHPCVQAQVTRLADANSPADLAALVAEASGLGECMSSIEAPKRPSFLAWSWLAGGLAAADFTHACAVPG